MKIIDHVILFLMAILLIIATPTLTAFGAVIALEITTQMLF